MRRRPGRRAGRARRRSRRRSRACRPPVCRGRPLPPLGPLPDLRAGPPQTAGGVRPARTGRAGVSARSGGGGTQALAQLPREGGGEAVGGLDLADDAVLLGGVPGGGVEERAVAVLVGLRLAGEAVEADPVVA